MAAVQYLPPPATECTAFFAGGYVAPAGASVTAALNHDLRWQVVWAQGFASSLFGTGLVRNESEYLHPSGIGILDWHQAPYGRHVTAEFSAYLVPFFDKVTARTEFVGSPKLMLDVIPPREIRFQGWESSTFGDVENVKRLLEFIAPQGIAPPDPHAPLAGAWLSARFQMDYVAPDYDKVTTGAMFLNAPRIFITDKRPDQWILPPGWGLSAVGTPDTSLFIRTLRMAGWSSHRFGVASLENTAAAIYPVGWKSLELGAPALQKPTDVWPNGIDSQVFGTVNVLNRNRRISAPGWRSDVFGQARVYNNARLLRASGWQSDAFGLALLGKPLDVWPAGWESGAVGGHTISNWVRSLQWHGRDWQSFGQPSIYNYNQHVFAGNISPRNGFGKPEVVHREFYPRPAGINSAAFGRPTLSHGVRRIYPAGTDVARYGAKAWFSHSPRSILAGSIDSLLWGRPVIAPTRYISPEGWDSAEYGTTIQPPVQTIYSEGWSSPVWGMPRVMNWQSFVRPSGWLTNGEEALRFGWQTVFNSTQHIVQLDDGLGGMDGNYQSDWTLVRNRNRVLGVVGFNDARFGYALAYLNARLLERMDWDSQAFGALMIGHGIRDMKAGGIDSFYSSGWHRVYNNARLIHPPGKDDQAFGRPKVESNRRSLRWLGNWDSQEFGTAWLDDAVRSVTVERRWSIEPPPVPMPEVKLQTRYIEQYSHGWDSARVGLAWLREEFKTFHPRWTKQNDDMGIPLLRNVTPEMHAYGRESLEFGQAYLRTEWRELEVEGTSMQLFGLALVSDRTFKVMPMGWRSGGIGLARVYNEFEPPPDKNRRIEPVGMFEVDSVGRPTLSVRTFNLNGWDSLVFGNTRLFDNAIFPESIHISSKFGTPFFQEKARYIYAGPFPDSEVFQPSKMRINPHTIYAVMEAPDQAKINHEARYLHYVNSGNGSRSPGAVFGSSRVSHYPPPPLQARGTNHQAFGHPFVSNSSRYIYPSGFTHRRMGTVEVLGGNQEIEQFDSSDFAAFGNATLSFPPVNPVPVRPAGLDSQEFGATWIDTFHRPLHVNGWDSRSMGRSSGGPRFMPQSLWVGEPDNPTFQGWDNATYGEQWVSLAIRQLEFSGIDTLTFDYELARFNERMRVVGTPGQRPPTTELVLDGFTADGWGVPDLKNWVQYIIPDGNRDMGREPLVWRSIQE